MIGGRIGRANRIRGGGGACRGGGSCPARVNCANALRAAIRAGRPEGDTHPASAQRRSAKPRREVVSASAPQPPNQLGRQFPSHDPHPDSLSSERAGVQPETLWDMVSPEVEGGQVSRAAC